MIEVHIENGSNRYTLKCWSENDMIYQILEKHGVFYEIKLLRYIQSLNIGGAYIDVGANIGNHSVFFAEECRADYVIAIEAYKPLCNLCTLNMENNVTSCEWVVHNVAVSNGENDLVELWLADEVNMGRTRLPIPGRNPKDVGLSGKTIKTKSVKLDTLLAVFAAGEIGLIKLDIEGAELEALESGLQVIEKCKPVIVAECSDGRDEMPNREMAQISALLKPLNYRLIAGPFGSQVAPVFVWRLST